MESSPCGGKNRDNLLVNLVDDSLQVLFLKLDDLVMTEPSRLTLEQQFSLRSFETQVDKMSREQAQEFLVKLYEQMMMRETMYKHFIKHEWGIDSSAA